MSPNFQAHYPRYEAVFAREVGIVASEATSQFGNHGNCPRNTGSSAVKEARETDGGFGAVACGN
jgi:hypothetical protein